MMEQRKTEALQHWDMTPVYQGQDDAKFEDALASELSLSGGNVWEKLHGTITSQLSVPFERDGKLEDVPMPALQNIRRYDPSKTPLDRLIATNILPAEVQSQLEGLHLSTNPHELPKVIYETTYVLHDLPNTVDYC